MCSIVEEVKNVVHGMVALVSDYFNNNLQIVWGKSLENMPLITIREINAHRANAGVNGEMIKKTMDRGRKFKEERYINANNIKTASSSIGFMVQAECTPSMGGLGTSKKKAKSICVTLCHLSGNVLNASCSCRQGQGGLCHHVVALLLELAEYSLSQLKEIPEEIACTSRLRAWGVPGQSSMAKEPIMATKVYSRYNKRGTTCTLYDPRIKESRLNVEERRYVLENPFMMLYLTNGNRHRLRLHF